MFHAQLFDFIIIGFPGEHNDTLQVTGYNYRFTEGLSLLSIKLARDADLEMLGGLCKRVIVQAMADLKSVSPNWPF